MKGLREEMTLRDHFAGLAMSGLATMEGYIGLNISLWVLMN